MVPADEAGLTRLVARLGPDVEGCIEMMSGAIWARAEHGARHGGGALMVAGRTLPTGFHWDVSRRKGSFRLLTAGEVWKLSGRHAYVNVYPDAYVRPPGMRQVRRAWPSRQGK